jgi:hypothetical protein
MTACLHVVAGGHELFLHGALVQRVWEVDALPGRAVGWAGRDIPLVDLAEMLRNDARPQAARIMIVYGREDDEPIALAVDDVRGLVTVSADGVAALPPVSEAFALLFDTIAVQPIEGRHPLCVRSRLDVPAVVAASRAHGGGP